MVAEGVQAAYMPRRGQISQISIILREEIRAARWDRNTAGKAISLGSGAEGLSVLIGQGLSAQK
jgi:hypothetical protein